MPASPFVLELREKVGTDLLFLPSATCVVTDGDRMLLVQHRDLLVWAFPGGGIDPGERPVDAAAREVWEETGWLVRPTELLGCLGGPEFQVTYPNGDRLAFVTTVYRAERTGGTQQACEEEVGGLGWFTMDEVLALERPPWMSVALPLLTGDHPRTPAEQLLWRPPG